ncbi:HAMP domain-containing histidine kinase [Cohnella nanjingensis]|uniref:histidine kinase n=1 Tax=Cohnella nanjingensis TaxID=1387779 RepID=A0A7X0RPV5_9BACL|nr:HAMP domain-containing histidine kinase [Cohnella nanjingensis]
MKRSIQSKFLVGFLIIFGVFFLILYLWMTANIESSNRNTVKSQLHDLKNNSNSYIQQSFLTHHFTNDAIYLTQIAEELGSELHHATSSEVALYSLSGELIYASKPALFESDSEDLGLALTGKTAFTLTRSDGKAAALFAYPVVVQGDKIGIVRFAKDFTPLYSDSAQMQRTIGWTALAVFAAAFLFSTLLSRHITIPLSKLTKASTEVANGNLKVRIGVKQQDEVGRLAANFSRMIEKLREQFAIIEQERDRLDALNQHRKRFFDQVTHELKTPLTTIIGYADMIRMKGARDPVLLDKGINHILNESKRLHEMVLELLEKSGAADTYDATAIVDMARIVQDVCEAMTMKAKRYKKTISCRTPNEMLLYGKPDRLRQLVINLVDNAIKYAYAHTEIDVAAELVQGQGRLIVSNQGETIDADHLKRIFEPYYRAGHDLAEAASVGLGLHICKSIVDEHQGKIEITSDNEQTDVEIYLPLTIVEERGQQ